MKYLLPILFLGIFFVNCNKEDQNLSYQAQLELDEQAIEDYLTQNNLTAEVGDFGLRYIIDEPGEGPNPTGASEVIVKYKGYLPDGTVFDERDVFQASLQGQVIRGWTIGIPLFKKGGKGTLFIPSSLAYSQFGRGTLIGPNQILIFDIELINFL